LNHDPNCLDRARGLRRAVAFSGARFRALMFVFVAIVVLLVKMFPVA
jgi:hypothetical protein